MSSQETAEVAELTIPCRCQRRPQAMRRRLRQRPQAMRKLRQRLQARGRSLQPQAIMSRRSRRRRLRPQAREEETTNLCGTPATGPSALSSAVNSSCKDLAWEASCPSGVTGRGKKTLGKRKQRQTTTDDRRQKTTDDAVWCLGMLLLT